jgi:hypothetical protein
LISFKGAPDVPFTDAMPAAAVFPFDELARLPVVTCSCGQHAAGACPDDYRRELEPADETIAELQSVVVAMRHRGDAVADLERDVELFAGQLLHVARLPDPVAPSRRLQLIRLSMALAAVAIRYREELKP